MGNIWVALSWSMAVVPAMWAVNRLSPQIEPHGPWAEAAVAVVAYLLFGKLMSGITVAVLGFLGIPVGCARDPKSVIERTRKLEAAGRIDPVEAQIRYAACRLALDDGAAALDHCELAEKAGPRGETRSRVRFLKARALEEVGRSIEGRELYLRIAADEEMPRLFRLAARVRAYGVAARNGTPADDTLTSDLASMLTAPAEPAKHASCCGSKCSGDLDDEEIVFLGENLLEMGRDPRVNPEVLHALELLQTRAESGRSRRAIQRLKKQLMSA